MTGTAVFIDCSGSTSGCRAYHDAVARIVCQHPGADLFVWDTLVAKAERGAVLDNARSGRCGYGGTAPKCIVEYVRDARLSIERLVLVTDGQIGRGDVDAVSNCLVPGEAPPWQAVEAHLLMAHPDVSVIAPFIADVPFTVHDFGESESIVECSLSMRACVEALDAIHDVPALRAGYDALHARLAAASVTREADQRVRDAILRMRARVVASMAASEGDAGERMWDDPAWPARPRAEVLGALEAIAARHYAPCDEGGGAPALADRLLSLCDRAAGDFSVARLQSARHARAYHEVGGAAPSVDALPDVAEQEWDDVILMQPTSCLLLPFKASGILAGADAAAIEAIERNPLLLLRYGGLAAALGDALLPPVSREALVAMRGHGALRHPTTRDSVLAEVAILGFAPEHVRANKAALARLLFGSTRLPGSYALWMLVLSSAVASREYAYPRADVERYVAELARTARVPMGLGCAGERPAARVPLAAALLYAVHSTRLFCEAHTKRDVMRDLFGAYGCVRWALGCVGIDVSDSDERVDVLARAARVLAAAKRAASDGRGAAFLRGHLAAVHETEQLGSATVILDALRPGADAGALRDLALAGMMDKAALNKTFGDLPLPFSLEARVSAILGAPRLYNAEENGRDDVCDVCPATLRPWTRVGGRGWEELAREAWGPPEGTVSMHREVARFIESNKRLPGEGDVQAIVESLAASKGPVLPVSVVAFSRKMVEQVAAAVGERPPDRRSDEAVVSDVRRGAARAARREMEDAWLAAGGRGPRAGVVGV
jgi:hypothetical protein